MPEDAETREQSPPDDGSHPEPAEHQPESESESDAESEAAPESHSPSEPEPSDSVADAEPSTTDGSGEPAPASNSTDGSGEPAPASNSTDGSGEPAPASNSTDSEFSTERSEKSADEVYCASCGEIIKQEAEICPECGVRQREPATQEKNPGLAAVASFFFAGLGQIYNGQIAKGIILMLVQSVNVLLMFVLVGFLTYPVVWIYGIWDAYTTAEKINSGEITV